MLDIFRKIVFASFTAIKYINNRMNSEKKLNKIVENFPI